MEEARSFLVAVTEDAVGPDEIRAQVRALVASHPASVRRKLMAIETVLGQEHPEGELTRFVGWDLNRALDDPTDAASAQWIADVADIVREELESAD